MPFRIIRNDITKMNTDAIVNTANPRPVIGGGTDHAIYQAAGAGLLLKERQKIGAIGRGQAAVTPAFNLKAKYIIHTAGPVWRGGLEGEEEILRACYENSLKLAADKGCRSIAFPLISTGSYGFPKDLALQIVNSVVEDFLLKQEMMIWLVVFDPNSTRLSEHLFEDIEIAVDDLSVSQAMSIEYDYGISQRRRRLEEPRMMASLPVGTVPAPKKKMRSLDDLKDLKEETFQQMLLRLIAEKGMTNSEAYTRANQDKKLFSKIKNNPDYQPKKKTAMAFALALELNMDEAKDLLARAGYAFSPSSGFDQVIVYFIENKRYNIFEVEEVLFEYQLGTLCNY